MKVLVTAGPTREAIDPVRFVSNRSSGKMGYAVAAAARARGHAVCLVSGPVALAPPPGVELVRVTTAEDMLAAVKRRVRGCDLLVMAAAVADWRPKNPARRKLKKSAGPPRIAWEPTPDILETLAPLKKKSQTFCGFAAETHGLAREARRKLREKNLDAIAANDVSKSDRGFEAERNALTIYFADGRARRVALAAKTKCAATLVRALEEVCAAKKK
ncbi:MAG TPA: phosphopantothenoylcysteine decarboxylase [Kiritimatiellia bacterium]|nr:phosphopantothenoylcysteine decarboxylase [Kiritimatiellia bacterium]